MQQTPCKPQSLAEALDVIADLNSMIVDLFKREAAVRNTHLQLESEIEALIQCIHSDNHPHSPFNHDEAWQIPMKAGRMIQAIKVYRAIYGCSLIDAKAAVDNHKTWSESNG